MRDLLAVVERGRDDLLAVEEYLAREKVGDQGAPDAAAPPPLARRCRRNRLARNCVRALSE
jgi:hypothetical protein